MIKLHFTRVFTSGHTFEGMTHQDSIKFPNQESVDHFKRDINKYKKRNKYFVVDFKEEVVG